MGRQGDYLEGAVTRAPLGDGARAGRTVERVVLADGRSLIVKRRCAVDDIVMALSGDDIGREYLLWSRGVLRRLPDSVDHAVVDGWLEEGAAVVVMRDLGSAVLDGATRLTSEHCRRVLGGLAAMHRAFLDDPPNDLAPLSLALTLYAPGRMRAYLGGPDRLPDLVLAGWEAFADLVSGDLCEGVFALLDDPGPLVAALLSRPCTLVHGDPAIPNLAISGNDLILLDWSRATAGPAALDVACLLARSGQAIDLAADEVWEEFGRLAGPAVDPESVHLAVVAGLMTSGWELALRVTEHPSEDVRQRAWNHLGWWTAATRSALGSDLL